MEAVMLQKTAVKSASRRVALVVTAPEAQEVRMTCRILVALDGMETAEAVLGDVERVATGGASVHFLYVVPKLPMNVDTTSAGVLAGHDRALSYLSGLRERFPDIRGLDVIRAG